jgi:hypothetical protein
MAAVHSRFRRVVFVQPRPNFSGLLTYGIHILTQLNHHFQAYQFDVHQFEELQRTRGGVQQKSESTTVSGSSLKTTAKNGVSH